MVKTVVGSFDNIAQAAAAARDLRTAGFPERDVSVIANDTVDNFTRDTDAKRATVGEDAASGAATGALTGGALGGAAGLAASLIGFAIPGFGPILAAGPIAAALAGAGAGAVAGGLIGGLTDLGVPETHAEYYAEAVRRGGAVVTVRADPARADEAERIVRDHGAFDIQDRVEHWKGSGWTGYDADAAPYSRDDIERERTLYQPTPRTTGSELRR